MGQTVFRANLSAMAFPFLSELSGRTIVVKQLDQNYTPQLSNKDDLDKDVGVPQLYYCHNVIATAQGYQSIDYESMIVGIDTNFVGVLSVLESSTGNRAYIGYTATGKFYYSKDPFYSWVYFTTITAAAGKQITSAYINGLTYIYVANNGCYKFNFTTNSFTSVTLTGLVAANILGILAVQGYLIAWASDAIAWSSLLDPTDFTPSLATGAGGGSVQGAKGSIVACVSHTIGLVVYTNQNAVAAPASNNARYPFNFRELVSSGGIASLDMVTYDANSGNHYTYTTSGLQLISLQQTQTVIPEVTDFLAGSVFEDFNDTTNTLSTQELTHTLKKRLSLISDRYLIISYGITEFTHAIIYDLALKRWGKLKFTHVQVFEFSLLTAETVETPRKSIALLSSTGAVHVVKIDSMNLGSSGVLLIGKYQLVRSRVTQLQSIDLENIPEAASVTCINCYTADGKNLIHETGFLQKAAGLFRRYLFHAVGVNHSVLLKGAFHLVSLVVSVTPHGRR